MLGFPQTTEFNKRIPKQKFYENIHMTSSLHRLFVDQIKSIYWKNKLASTTLNINQGKIVTEIEVIEIKLSGSKLDECVLKQIDHDIPYHVLFILSYNEKIQAWIGYKNDFDGNNPALDALRYFHTDWIIPDEYHLNIDGLTLDDVYENFMIQIGNIKLECGKTLSEYILRNDQIQTIQKKIDKLESQARREKQPNKKFMLAQQVNILKIQLKSISLQEQ